MNRYDGQEFLWFTKEKNGLSSNQIRLILDYQLDQYTQALLDADKVEKIITNFLSNVIKFTPREGEIRLSIKRAEGDLLVSVADSGLGIPEEEVDKIFGRFYQTKDTDKSTGAGIGLALCRELANLMEGKVWAESELGKGSVFFL